MKGLKVTTPNYKKSNQGEVKNKDNDRSMMGLYFDGMHNCSQDCSPPYGTKLQHD